MPEYPSRIWPAWEYLFKPFVEQARSNDNHPDGVIADLAPGLDAVVYNAARNGRLGLDGGARWAVLRKR